MTIVELMNEFALIPNAVVGHGPTHPTKPNPDLRGPIQDFLSRFLTRDVDYVRFLEMYAGAGIYSQGSDDLDNLFLCIFGFDDEVTEVLEDGETPIIDENGFFCFCESYERFRPKQPGQSSNEGLAYFGFAFDTTGTRTPGVYACSTTTSRESFSAYNFDSGSFLEWLAKLVAQGGKFYGRR